MRSVEEVGGAVASKRFALSNNLLIIVIADDVITALNYVQIISFDRRHAKRSRCGVVAGILATDRKIWRFGERMRSGMGVQRGEAIFTGLIWDMPVE